MTPRRSSPLFLRGLAALLATALTTAACSSTSPAPQGAQGTSTQRGGTSSVGPDTVPSADGSTPAPTVGSPDTSAAPDTITFDTPAPSEPAESVPRNDQEGAVTIGTLAVARVAAPVWGTCSDETLSASGLQCATVSMPVDHAQPNAKKFQLALSRVKATGKRRGTMFVNPGGPGGSGTMYASSVASRMPKEITTAYDIVGFDPRGTGESMPVDCVDDAFLDESAMVDPTPDTPAELAEMKSHDLEQRCLAKYPDLATYSTLAVVQDLEALRVAVGDPKLTYYGVSYGSYLGAVYASAFPASVGAMVLDGAFLPETTGNEATIVQFGGFNRAFDNWASWCESSTGCPFQTTDVDARYLTLADELDKHPLTVGTRTVGEGTLALATIASLYSKMSWPILAAALEAAEKGNGAGLLAVADAYNQRNPSTGRYEPLSEANTVISCASGITQPTTGDLEVFTKRVQALGTLGRFVSNTDWETDCHVPQPKVAYNGSAPLVVIGGKNDPATPYSQALALTDALGPQASLITFTGEGHGGLFDSTCAKDAVRAYYLEGTRPSKGLTCAAAVAARPSGALAALPVPKGLVEVDIEGGAQLLGLDSANFAARVFRSDTVKVYAQAKSELLATTKAAGFESLYETDLPGIPDASFGGLQRIPDVLLYAVFGPKAMQSEDLLGVAPLAGEGSLVVVAAPINAEALKSLGG